MCRVVAFYAMGYRGVMELPLRAFWLMASCIERIEAEHQRKALEVALCSENAEAAKALSERLTQQVGEVARRKPKADVFDREGFEALRRIR